MGVKPRKKRVKSSRNPPVSLPLLESLSDSQISVLYLARLAKENKQEALAKKLTSEAQSLRKEIARLRHTASTEWDKKTKSIVALTAVVCDRLNRIINQTQKKTKNLATFNRAIDVLSKILKMIKKVS
jgi:replication fork clamp-binding protein CrfC